MACNLDSPSAGLEKQRALGSKKSTGVIRRNIQPAVKKPVVAASVSPVLSRLVLADLPQSLPQRLGERQGRALGQRYRLRPELVCCWLYASTAPRG